MSTVEFPDIKTISLNGDEIIREAADKLEALKNLTDLIEKNIFLLTRPAERIKSKRNPVK